MHNANLKPGLLVVMSLLVTSSWAAPRDANRNDAAMAKLQAMVKSLTSERDAAKSETGKLTAEIESLRKERDSALAGKDQASGALAAQKNASEALHGRLEQANARLSESADKVRELGQVKAGLTQELSALKAQQQSTEQQLKLCGEHNGKLVKSAQELLERYQSKGTMAALLQDEPLLQFQSVEMEDIRQRYRDEIDAGKYQAPNVEVVGN